MGRYSGIKRSVPSGDEIRHIVVALNGERLQKLCSQMVKKCEQKEGLVLYKFFSCQQIESTVCYTNNL